MTLRCLSKIRQCQAISSTHKIASRGPSSPTNIPPILKSFCSSNPVLKAIAFGGEDTGKNIAVEAENAMIRAISFSCPTIMAMPRGIITVLAAVLLMIFETSIVIKAKTNIRAMPFMSSVISFPA